MGDTVVSNPSHTVGLKLRTDGATPGYTLFAPLSSDVTYLIDLDGEIVHSWAAEWHPGNSVYLMDDGRMLRASDYSENPMPPLRAGGNGGRVDLFEWDGSIAWSVVVSTDFKRQHHDMEPLPSGNVALIVWERKLADEVLAAGRDPGLLSEDELWPDTIVEYTPAGDIEWEWHVWDHLVQSRDPALPTFGQPVDHPDKVDLNYVRGEGKADWQHVNSLAADAAGERFLMSVHGFDELWIVDRATGALAWRWGNPEAWGGGTPADRELFGQHDAQWIAAGRPGAGNILVFDNGAGRPDGDFSRVLELTEDKEIVWVYRGDPLESFFSRNISGAERLWSGATLICEGRTGRLFEVTTGGERVWEYISPIAQGTAVKQGDPIPTNPQGQTNLVFRARRYPLDHPGLVNRDLTPKGRIELP